MTVYGIPAITDPDDTGGWMRPTSEERKELAQVRKAIQTTTGPGATYDRTVVALIIFTIGYGVWSFTGVPETYGPMARAAWIVSACLAGIGVVGRVIVMTLTRLTAELDRLADYRHRQLMGVLTDEVDAAEAEVGLDPESIALLRRVNDKIQGGTVTPIRPSRGSNRPTG